MSATERPTKYFQICAYVQLHSAHFGFPPTALALRTDEEISLRMELAHEFSGVTNNRYERLSRFMGMTIVVDDSLKPIGAA